VSTVTTSAVVRSILTQNINLTADEVIQKAQSRGVTAAPDSIRALVYNIRGEVKRAAAARNGTPGSAGPAAKAAPSVRPATKVMGTVPRVASQPLKLVVAPKPKSQPASSPTDLAGILANVALVNRVIGLCGGAENARQAAEAVRACGGVDEFFLHLDLVAGITSGQAAA
jgi:hypothetical protein